MPTFCGLCNVQVSPLAGAPAGAEILVAHEKVCPGPVTKPDRHARARAALAFVNKRLADARDRVRLVEANLKDARYQLAQVEALADLATKEAIETGDALARSGPVATGFPLVARAVPEGEILAPPDDHSEAWR